MAHLRFLPLLLALAGTTALAQTDDRTPLRDAHVVTVSQADDGGYVFEVEGQRDDFEAALNPDGTLVVVATDGLRVMAVTEDRGYYMPDEPTNRPLLVGPNAVWIDGRRQDEVGVLRVVPEIPRAMTGSLELSLFVCTAETPLGSCPTWEAARPLRRRAGPDGPTGLEASLWVRVVGGPIILSPGIPTDPPARPVRD